MAEAEETRQPAALGLVGVDREGLVVATARVGDVIAATAQGAAQFPVDDIHRQGGVDADGRVEGRGRLPGAVAHAADELAGAAAGLQGGGDAIDGDDIAAVVQALDLEFQALQGGVDEAHRGAGGPLLPHDVPGLQGGAQGEPDAAGRHLADEGEAELEMGGEPGRIEGEAGLVERGDHILEVVLDKGGQQKAVVQAGAPARQAGGARAAVRLAPEPGDQRPQQELLHQAHAGVGRHLEGPQLQQAQAARRPVGGIELVDAELTAVGIAAGVDEQVAQAAVHQPGGHGATNLLRASAEATVQQAPRRTPPRIWPRTPVTVGTGPSP